MKRAIAALIAVFMLIMSQAAYSAGNPRQLAECMKQMSSLQSYLEFVYMHRGFYPESLEELNMLFNSDVRRDSDRIIIPEDPATGKKFIYSPSKDLKTYSISAPDPSYYGMDSIELRNVRWGWMNTIAEQTNAQIKSELCGQYLTGLMKAVKKYQEEKKKLPSDIKELVPGYLKGIPKCPLCGKPYYLKLTSEDLVIYCPSPMSHGCSSFCYSLKKGVVVRPASEKKD